MKRAAGLQKVASVNVKVKPTRIKNTKKPTDSNNEATTVVSASGSTQSLICKPKQLKREFYIKSSLELCKDLLGKVLVRRLPHGEIIKGTIVETEAYPGTNVDEASASYNGKITDKNKAMFMEPGTAYVYMTYGMYHCFNISSEGEGAACLLRAIEPLEGFELMQKFRQKSRKKVPPSQKSKNVEGESNVPDPKSFKFHELTNGPGKLCMAFDIRRDNCDKIDLASSDELWLEEDEQKRDFETVAAKRIGIDSAPAVARNKLWRFYIENNKFVSTLKASHLKIPLDTVNNGE